MARVSREQETRAALPAHIPIDPTFNRAELLDMPEPPEGKKYLWVRVGNDGREDTKNIMLHMRKGWSPVDASTVPQTDGHYMPVAKHGFFPDTNIIQVNELVLFERSVDLHRRERESIDGALQRQMTAVNANMFRDGVGDKNGYITRPEYRAASTKGSESPVANMQDVHEDDIL